MLFLKIFDVKDEDLEELKNRKRRLKCMTNYFLFNNFKHLTTTPASMEQLRKMVLQMAVQGK